MPSLWKKFTIPQRRLEDYPLHEKRRGIEKNMERQVQMKGTGFENKKLLHRLLKWGLKTLKLSEQGLYNVLNLKVVEKTFLLSNFPKKLDGLRILHLSDMHLDGVPGLLESLQKLLPTLEYDLCVITGDFRFGKRTFSKKEIEPSLELLKSIDAPLGTYAVLGNHDFIEQVPYFEKAGMRVLLNESLPLDEEENLWLLGVDDPHLYFCNDLPEAQKNLPEDVCKILLVHSPEIVEEAEESGVDLYLCGHTHGGQIRLPIIGAPFSNARCKRKYAFADFNEGEMQGYTHNGTGASSVAARFKCPSEVVIHTLKNEKA